MRKIDFNISNTNEKFLVGVIQYINGKYQAYFNEKEMLEDYKDTLNTVSSYAINEYTVYPSENNARHGLSYNLIKEQYEQLGLHYSEIEYIAKYVTPPQKISPLKVKEQQNTKTINDYAKLATDILDIVKER